MDDVLRMTSVIVIGLGLLVIAMGLPALLLERASSRIVTVFVVVVALLVFAGMTVQIILVG